MGLALIAAQLIGANIMRGENITNYFRNENGIRSGIKDEKLIDALKIAQRLTELAGN